MQVTQPAPEGWAAAAFPVQLKTRALLRAPLGGEGGWVEEAGPLGSAQRCPGCSLTDTAMAEPAGCPCLKAPRGEQDQGDVKKGSLLRSPGMCEMSQR